jgi:redox-sensitive bicupin YhaK (pirin superfamily)/CBS domain-containing protein
MKASEVMSTPVIGVSPDTTVRDIAGLLSARRISAVPVLEGERLVGLVSEADLLGGRQLGGGARRARDIMTREVQTVAPDTPVEEIAAVLEERRIKRVPVLQAGRVVGIVSRSNLVQALAVESNVVIDDGVAHYWGRSDSDEERAAARAAAERLPGVRRVEDHRPGTPRPPAPLPGPQIRRAQERGHSKHGWVDSYHSFSFGNFYDLAYTGYGPLRALNEKRVQPGKGSSTYGLRDVEIITCILDGALAHDDSLDQSAVLSAGGVQCLSAGSGVRFSESNRSPSEVCHFLQIWIEPAGTGQPAAYAYRHFSPESKRGRLRAIVSPDGRDESLRLRQDAVLYAGLFDGDERARLEVAAERLVYVHVARGTITAQGQALAAGDGLAAAGGTIVLEHGRDAEVLVFDLPEASAGGASASP